MVSLDKKRIRLQRLREILKGKEQEALLVCKEENQIWLTGFRSDNCYLVITESTAELLTDSRYTEAAEDHVEGVYGVTRLDPQTTVFRFLEKSGVRQLAVEEESITASFYKELQQRNPAISISDGSNMVETLRAVKDPEELERIAAAEALGDRCFEHMLGLLKPGLTEQECALEIEWYFRRNGASGLSFPTICIFGEKTSLPHGEPGDKVLKNGDFVTMDFGCVLDGYCSDMTRTVAMGSVTEEQRKVYEIVLEAQLAGCAALKAGLSCAEGDKAARSIIEAAGYGEHFGHGLGHGVGLEIHEAPTLNPRSKEILAQNMTVTVEPGIYLPKKFGIRIEDLAFITESGIIIASHSPKELIIL